MVRRRLTLYDVIVDLIPGLLTVGILLWLGVVPGQSGVNNLNLSAGLVLLAGGYAVGRIIHGITGLFEEILLSCYESRWDDIRFESRLDSINDGRTSVRIPYIGEKEVKIKSKELTMDIENRENIKYMSQSILYQGQGLSWKYSLLSTFFRNMWLIALLGAALVVVVGYSLHQSIVVLLLAAAGLLILTSWVCMTINDHEVNNPAEFLVGIFIISLFLVLLPHSAMENLRPIQSPLPVAGLLLTISLITLHQYFKFKERESRAMINELYLALDDKVAGT